MQAKSLKHNISVKDYTFFIKNTNIMAHFNINCTVAKLLYSI